jgi:uncharacterized damage-inducible protein DinB
MTSLSRRLQRLEATTARLDLSERAREFEEFSRAAEEYIRSVRQYLGEPPDREMTISCRNESEITPVINQMRAYHIRSLRHYYHHRGSVGECWIGNAPPERRVRSVAGDNEDD